MFLGRHGDTQSTKEILKADEKFFHIIDKKRNVDVRRSLFMESPVVNQIPLAFRYRISNDSIDLKIRTCCVDSVNIFEGFCRNLARGTLLAGLETAKGQESAKQGRKDATNFS